MVCRIGLILQYKGDPSLAGYPAIAVSKSTSAMIVYGCLVKISLFPDTLSPQPVKLILKSGYVNTEGDKVVW